MPLGSLPPILYRDGARFLFVAGWTGLDNLFKMLATAGGESDLYPKAWHHNNDGSTDWGWLQLNDGHKGGAAPAVDAHGDAIPDPSVKEFATKACDPQQAAMMGRDLWEEPAPSLPGGIRGITPWYAYTNGGWVKHQAQAATGIRNFLADKYGFARI
jgi:hypothetical protein